MNRFAPSVLSSLAMAFSSVAFAQASPVGVWSTLDDTTGKPTAEIQISESGSLYTGKVLRSLRPEEQGRNDVCVKCTDDRKDKPMVGLEIIRGVASEANDGAWDGGNILDPSNGKLYRLRLRLLDEDKRLQVRGYLGPFYRTQIWQRLQ